MNAVAIPPELESLPRWVTWRTRTRFGRAMKIPYCPTTGRAASVTDPRTWGTFSQAISAAARYDGVGFVLTRSDGIVGLDLDGCVGPEGNLNHLAREVVRKVCSYTELSPSGSGIRIFAKGSLPPGGRKMDGVEMYDDRRFLSVTGRRLPKSSAVVENRRDVLAALHAQLFKARPYAHDALPRGWLGLVKEVPALSQAWAGEGGDHPDTSGSGQDMKLAHLARRYGFGPEDVKVILRRAPYPVGGGRTDQYLELTVSKAFARPVSVQAEAPFAPVPMWPMITGAWSSLSPTAKAIYPILCSLTQRSAGRSAASWKELLVRCSMGILAARAGAHADRVARAMHELEQHRMVRRERAPAGKWNVWVAFKPPPNADKLSEHPDPRCSDEVSEHPDPRCSDKVSEHPDPRCSDEVSEHPDPRCSDKVSAVS